VVRVLRRVFKRLLPEPAHPRSVRRRVLSSANKVREHRRAEAPPAQLTEARNVEIGARGFTGGLWRRAPYSPSPWVPHLQRPSTHAHPPEYCCQEPGMKVAPLVGWTMYFPGTQTYWLPSQAQRPGSQA
jgi:hypothetical protein